MSSNVNCKCIIFKLFWVFFLKFALAEIQHILAEIINKSSKKKTWFNMNQTYQEWSLGGPHSKIYRIAKSSIQDGF